MLIVVVNHVSDHDKIVHFHLCSVEFVISVSFQLFSLLAFTMTAKKRQTMCSRIRNLIETGFWWSRWHWNMNAVTHLAYFRFTATLWDISGQHFHHTLMCKPYKEKTLSCHKRNSMKHPVMRETIWGGDLHHSARKMCRRVYGFWGCHGNSSNPSLK